MFISDKRFHKTIIFTKLPLSGKFRYKDVFQIYPVVFDGMPSSKFYQKHHPVFLEFYTYKEEYIEINKNNEQLEKSYSENATILKKIDRILSILSISTNHLFFRYEDKIGAWGMIEPLESQTYDEINKMESRWFLPKYSSPLLKNHMSNQSFNEIELPDIKFIPFFDYYYNEPNFDYYLDDSITFPDTLSKTLDSYFSKSKLIQTAIDSANSFLVSAMQLRSFKKTASSICAFTAIETMINLEFDRNENEKCISCGQKIFSVRKKYRSYLLKYVGDSPENKKKFNMFYDIRSKIVHTGQMLSNESIYNKLNDTEKLIAHKLEIEILQLAKISVIKWLLENP
jgi:hypothetical protein